MWIMISGPFRHGSKDPKVWNTNLKEMNTYAYQVFQKGHVPVIGVNVALPIIEHNGWDKYDELMMPVSMAMAERCDAVLRIGGESNGADQEMDYFIEKGLPVYKSIDEIPIA